MNNAMMIEQTIPSMEVAEMVEKEHSKLLRDIRRYSNQFNEAKIGFVDFWRESAYTDSKGEERPCFLVTKKGCEFIAHKTTGTKGTIFTARYINRFHEMENEIINNNVSSIIEQKSDVPLVPLKTSWYAKNYSMITTICQGLNMKHQELYHMILANLGTKYDINAARQIYKKKWGYYPEYAIDIVGYFPELEEMAEEILNTLYRIAVT